MKRTLCRRTLALAMGLLLIGMPARAQAAEERYTLIQLSESDVTLEQTEYPYTGEEIRPNVTVRVRETLLTLDKDYTLEYADNIEIGTGKVLVTGIATASETLGYTGTVEIPFAIVAKETQPEVTEPETTEPELTEPETTEPEETVPETTVPETTVPETTEPETKPVAYKITKGDKSTWYRSSSKNLSFTANGDIKKFDGIKVDGKLLAEKSYTVASGSTVVTLKKAFLQTLGLGKHTVTILFEDGQAEATFQISNTLDTSNPETGDSFPMGLWITVLTLSSAAVIGVLAFRKKFFS